MTKNELKKYRRSLDMTQEEFGIHLGIPIDKNPRVRVSSWENSVDIPYWVPRMIELLKDLERLRRKIKRKLK